MMSRVRSDLPGGTVTFLFTDVEGSTRLLQELGAEGYAAALAEHRRVVREAVAAHGGVEVDTQGDAFFVAFPTAPGALAAAEEALAGLAAGPIRVRMGLHTGTPLVTGEGYVGVDVHRAARIAAVGHGGQTLVSASTTALVGTERLRDLGEHRLRDLSAPERIYQLGEKEFPPLKSLYRTNLPVPATPFLGRERELGEVLALLADTRLVTLTGPGGTGKTRLGLQAAAESSERFPDGVFWVPLAPLRDPELVLESAAQAVGAKDGLAAHVTDKSMLLLLDNFEHVVEAANRLVGLLAACPNLHVLVTSRELLRLPGEQAYPVPPLERQDGTQLFLARARAADPGFVATDAVPELCERLEQLPLALELAAARLRVLSPEQLLDRLSQRLDLFKAGRGVDPRQQTLRATFEWSHDLLGEEEQHLFARLAVFAGGCTLESAEAVSEADLDTLQSLVDKSLVRIREGDRFWMLETIRGYALERLEASGEADDLRRRHAEHFLALVEEAEPHVQGPAPERWLDRLEGELGNLRAALDTLEARGESQLVLRLAGALWALWNLRGHLVEGRRRLESALRADPRPTADRAKALNTAAELAAWAGDQDDQRTWAEEALAIHRALGDAWGAAWAEWQLAFGFAQGGDLERARELLEDSVRLFRDSGDEHHALTAGRTLAWIHSERGDRRRARALNEEGLPRARALGDRQMEATFLGVLATMYAAEEGRYEEAIAMLGESSALWRGLGDRMGAMVDLTRLGAVLAAAGKPEAGAQLLASAEALREELGAAFEPWNVRLNEGTLAAIHEQLDDGSFARAWEAGTLLAPDQAVALALGALDD